MEVAQLQQRDHRRLKRIVTVLALLALGICIFFFIYDLTWSSKLILRLRSVRLASMIIVAINLSVSTILFQALTHNPILSPGVLGFEAMYSLIATGLIFFFGQTPLATVPRWGLFLIQMAGMIGVCLTFYLRLLVRNRANLYKLVLVGLVLGTFLRSLTSMMVSIMDPNEFLKVQDAKTASFSAVDLPSFWVVTVISMGLWFVIWRNRAPLNILSLGDHFATNLGLDYERRVKQTLIICACLVAGSTALVGPLTFFGLLIAQLASYLLGSQKMQYYLLAASCAGICVLVGGQAVLEHVLGFSTILPVILEIFGGSLLFIFIMRRVRS